MYTAIDSLPEPVLSPNLIYEDRREVKQVLSEYVLQQDGNVSPVKQILQLNRGPTSSAVINLLKKTIILALFLARAACLPRGLCVLLALISFLIVI